MNSDRTMEGKFDGGEDFLGGRGNFWNFLKIDEKFNLKMVIREEGGKSAFFK